MQNPKGNLWSKLKAFEDQNFTLSEALEESQREVQKERDRADLLQYELMNMRATRSWQMVERGWRFRQIVSMAWKMLRQDGPVVVANRIVLWLAGERRYYRPNTPVVGVELMTPDAHSLLTEQIPEEAQANRFRPTQIVTADCAKVRTFTRHADWAQNEAEKADLFYFLHLPKTGGTTLYSLLQKQFRPELICPYSRLIEFIKKSPEEYRHYQLVSGHLMYMVQLLFDRMPIYMTFLRDPVERTISHYSHIVRNPDHYLHEQVRNTNLEEFLSDPKLYPMIVNLQTRHIGLDLDPRVIAAALDEKAALTLP